MYVPLPYSRMIIANPILSGVRLDALARDICADGAQWSGRGAAALGLTGPAAPWAPGRFYSLALGHAFRRLLAWHLVISQPLPGSGREYDLGRVVDVLIRQSELSDAKLVALIAGSREHGCETVRVLILSAALEPECMIWREADMDHVLRVLGGVVRAKAVFWPACPWTWTGRAA